jgi:dienelactone hydrolase
MTKRASIWRHPHCALVVCAVLSVAVAAACTGGGGSDVTSRDTTGPRAQASSTTTTAVPTTAPPTTTVPDISEIPRPANVTEDGYQWYVHSGADQPRSLLAVRRSAQVRRHPAVLLADTSGGFNLDYLMFADDLVNRGFDVAVGCVYSAPDALDPAGRRIPCADAPLFDGVADTMVAQLDALVKATYEALGVSTPLAVMGFSRGAGIAALRASAGRPEAAVLVSGRYEGWGGALPGELVNVGDHVTGWRAPTLILHGTLDGAVPVSQAYALEAALRAVGADVVSHYYEGAGHNLSGEPAVGPDLEDRTVGFLCARLVCPA